MKTAFISMVVWLVGKSLVKKEGNNKENVLEYLQLGELDNKQG